MSDLPGAPGHLRREREGILAVASEVNRLGLIWRETQEADVGIDGQIELVDDEGRATGQLVAVQVKSGPSHFHEDGNVWRFYPDRKHRFYWEQFPIPVLVVLHSPWEEISYWVDARLALRSPARSALKYIAVPKNQQLQTATSEGLFSSIGVSSRPFLRIEDVLLTMATSVTGSGSFPVSFLELFANGLVNIARSLYYGMDLAYEIASTNAEDDAITWGFGAVEFDFLLGYVKFLAEQRLAEVNISDCLVDWFERGMEPTFIVPLTSRGRDLVALMQQTQGAFADAGALKATHGLGVAQEGSVTMDFNPSSYLRMSLIRAFRELVASGENSP